jgi:hypothetical protein
MELNINVRFYSLTSGRHLAGIQLEVQSSQYSHSTYPSKVRKHDKMIISTSDKQSQISEVFKKLGYFVHVDITR